jgi:hypothetical protein
MRIITETAELKAFASELERGPFAAIDTEFMRDQTYWPKLCLIQAAGPESAAIIDPLSKGLDLSPLYHLLAAKKVMKVFHAARRDIKSFSTRRASYPTAVRHADAAMVCGFGGFRLRTLVRKDHEIEIDRLRASPTGAAALSTSVSWNTRWPTSRICATSTTRSPGTCRRADARIGSKRRKRRSRTR